MIVVPPRYYCIITNPVLRDEEGQPLADHHGQIRLRYGDQEIRFAQDPFPLYPGEELAADVTRLQVVETNQALRLRAIAAAGPELQVRLLQGLGLKSMLITDGRSPINLFNTANGLVNPLSLPIQE
jgi:hypothetical protein